MGLEPSSTAVSGYLVTVVRPGVDSVSILTIKRSLGLFTLFLVSESLVHIPGKVQDWCLCFAVTSLVAVGLPVSSG